MINRKVAPELKLSRLVNRHDVQLYSPVCLLAGPQWIKNGPWCLKVLEPQVLSILRPWSIWRHVVTGGNTKCILKIGVQNKSIDYSGQQTLLGRLLHQNYKIIRLLNYKKSDWCICFQHSQTNRQQCVTQAVLKWTHAFDFQSLSVHACIISLKVKLLCMKVWIPHVRGGPAKKTHKICGKSQFSSWWLSLTNCVCFDWQATWTCCPITAGGSAGAAWKTTSCSSIRTGTTWRATSPRCPSKAAKSVPASITNTPLPSACSVTARRLLYWRWAVFEASCWPPDLKLYTMRCVLQR